MHPAVPILIYCITFYLSSSIFGIACNENFAYTLHCLLIKESWLMNIMCSISMNSWASSCLMQSGFQALLNPFWLLILKQYNYYVPFSVGYSVGILFSCLAVQHIGNKCWSWYNKVKPSILITLIVYMQHLLPIKAAIDLSIDNK